MTFSSILACFYSPFVLFLKPCPLIFFLPPLLLSQRQRAHHLSSITGQQPSNICFSQITSFACHSLSLFYFLVYTPSSTVRLCLSKVYPSQLYKSIWEFRGEKKQQQHVVQHWIVILPRKWCSNCSSTAPSMYPFLTPSWVRQENVYLSINKGFKARQCDFNWKAVTVATSDWN